MVIVVWVCFVLMSGKGRVITSFCFVSGFIGRYLTFLYLVVGFVRSPFLMLVMRRKA